MENLNGFAFFSALAGNEKEISVSDDGKAINITSEIASEVPITLTIRPSTSMGVAADADIDGTPVRHIEGIPKF